MNGDDDVLVWDDNDRCYCCYLWQTASVASQHAVVEYCDLKDWYVLQDLDTMFGTNVNGSIIKNTAIQLKSGDVIRFGSHPVLYEFYIDPLNKVNIFV